MRLIDLYDRQPQIVRTFFWLILLFVLIALPAIYDSMFTRAIAIVSFMFLIGSGVLVKKRS